MQYTHGSLIGVKSLLDKWKNEQDIEMKAMLATKIKAQLFGIAKSSESLHKCLASAIKAGLHVEPTIPKKKISRLFKI